MTARAAVATVAAALALAGGCGMAGTRPGPAAPSTATTPRWRTVVLGRAQDGGMPHLGCTRDPCAAARRGERPAERVACLGITDGTRGWLVDATPDLAAQVHDLGVRAPAGVFLTHAHMGHVTGLLWLGKEVLGGRGIPVYATPALRGLLEGNEPWRRLVAEGRIALADNASVDLGGVRVSAFRVPHRDETGDTVGYLVEGVRRRVAYLPDIDAWEAWDRDVRDLVTSVDVAYLDATFFSGAELGGRDMREVPHPTVETTMDRLQGLGGRVRFLHMNHTNPILSDPSPVEARGFAVARQGEEVEL